jgi:hypothetical protein
MQEELLREILTNHKYPEIMQSGDSSGGIVPEEAHFNLKEVELLNSLQGHEVRLPDHGNIRSFMPLAELFSDPTYLRLVRQIVENLDEHQVDDNEIEYAVDEFTEENRGNTTMQPESPLATLEAADGIKGDTEICLCPSNMLDFFDEMRGFRSVNPKDGKRQYFLPIIGAILGGLAGPSIAGGLMGGAALGTIGSALATGAGSFLGSKLMGAKTGDALKYGALGGLGSVAAPALGNMIGGVGGMFGNSTAPIAGNASAQATQAAAATAPNVASGASSGIMDSLGLGTMFTPKVMIPTALMGGMLYKANKDQMKLQKQYEQQMNAYNQNHEKASAGLKDYFSNVDVSAHKEPQRDYINSNQTELGSSYGMDPMYGSKTGQYYAKGGQIENKIEDKSGGIIGKGKGQQDNIHTDYDVGDYIMPADVTAGLGDGHTDAGYDQLDNLKNYIYGNKDIHKAYEKVPGNIKVELTKKQPVAVSPGEYRFDKNVTVAVGDGNLKKADAIFQEFYKLVRDDKRTSGNTIPKKAKTAIEYFKNAQKKVEKKMGR